MSTIGCGAHRGLPLINCPDCEAARKRGILFALYGGTSKLARESGYDVPTTIGRRVRFPDSGFSAPPTFPQIARPIQRFTTPLSRYWISQPDALLRKEHQDMTKEFDTSKPNTPQQITRDEVAEPTAVIDQLDAFAKLLTVAEPTAVIDQTVIMQLDALAKLFTDGRTPEDRSVRERSRDLANAWIKRTPIGRAPELSVPLMEALAELEQRLGEANRWEVHGPALHNLKPTAAKVVSAGRGAIALYKLLLEMRQVAREPVAIDPNVETPAHLRTFPTKVESGTDWGSWSRDAARATATIERDATTGAPRALVLGPQLPAHARGEAQALADKERDAGRAPLGWRKGHEPQAGRTPVVAVDRLDQAPENHSTFAIPVERGGDHWRAIVRRGIAGSRALLGTIVATDRDLAHARGLIGEAVDAVVHNVAVAVVGALVRDRMIVGTLTVSEVGRVRDAAADAAKHSARGLLLEALVEAFGLVVTS